jgi:predicted RNA binding protein with dsRBD fold (UPF0201 family)
MSEVYRIDVEVTAPVNDTEVTDRVADAILNVFPNADVEWSVPRTDEDASGDSRGRRHGELIATTHTLDRFAERLREQEILDTARRQLLEDRRGDTITFRLKKQAAFEGVVNFAVGDPAELGDLHVGVRVHEPDVETFVRSLAPPTEGGVPVDEDA